MLQMASDWPGPWQTIERVRANSFSRSIACAPAATAHAKRTEVSSVVISWPCEPTNTHEKIGERTVEDVWHDGEVT